MTNTNVPQWEEDLEKVDIAQDWGIASSYLYDYLDMDKLKAFIRQAIQEERQRIVEIVLQNSEEQFVGNANSRLIADTDKIINLIHKE